ncbi:MAG: gliding motility lipoprotein GldH [Bacteroidales bacterium]
MFRFPTFLFAIFILFAVVSCRQDGTYSEFRDIPSKGWNRYDTLFFSPKLDSARAYKITLETRNHANYPYQNIWFFIHCQQDTTVLFSDTVQVILADKMGKWFGSGWGSLYELSTPYKSSVRFPKSNKPLTIKVIQGMRDYDLQGIESVGLTIQPIN